MNAPSGNKQHRVRHVVRTNTFPNHPVYYRSHDHAVGECVDEDWFEQPHLARV